MRTPVLLVLAIIPAAAQSPLARIVNTSGPVSRDFQIGDRFEIVITGAPNQPVSVRTTRHGRTDWSPVIGSTDSTGRWSVGGQFEKSDFGGWSEIWTVGGKLADPTIQFSVNAPCLPGGQGFASVSGPNVAITCETASGRQTFVTPSLTDPLRTPDGSLVPERGTEKTPEQYHMQVLQDLIITRKESRVSRIALQSAKGGLGDETAELISTLIGVNALDGDETRNSLAILRAAFEKPETVQPLAKNPSRTLLLLRHLEDINGQGSLRQEIAETRAYIGGH